MEKKINFEYINTYRIFNSTLSQKQGHGLQRFFSH